MKTLTVDQIIEMYNDEARSAEESALHDESPHGEFCSSFGYGDADLSETVKASDLREETKAALLKLPKREAFDLLASHSELKTCGIYIQLGEVYSISLGELEVQPSDELLAAFEALTPEEQAQVRKQADVYISDRTCKGWMYVDCNYDRFVMICDEDALNEALGIVIEA